MAAMKIKLKELSEEDRVIELAVPEDAEVPSAKDDAVIIIVVKKAVGIFGLRPGIYDWFIER